jgi:hypothetical protein
VVKALLRSSRIATATLLAILVAPFVVALRGGVAGAAPVPVEAAATGAPPPTGGTPLAAEHRHLMELIQGGTVMIAASPALCSAAGAATLDAPSASTDPRDWYFRTGACMLPFATDYLGVVTRATQGLDRDLIDRTKVEALRGAVAQVRARIGEAASQERLLLHSTAWELLYALDAPTVAAIAGTAPGGSPQAALRCELIGLLRDSSYTPEQAAALPATLTRLPALAGVDAIADLARRIDAHDPDLVELLPPPEAHARLLHGRFTLRVFFTGKTPEASRKVREYLLATPYDRLGRLALETPDVVAVLLLYFNVLDHDLRIIPTQQIAFWQQYGFDGQLTLDREEMEQANATVHFLSIRYQRNYETDEPRYASLPETAMSRTGFVDGMPSQMSAPATTLRGACIRCHRRVISSFHPEEKREVRFTKPFEVSGRDLLTTAYTEGAEGNFAKWAATCQ